MTKEIEEHLLALPGINWKFIQTVLSTVRFANELTLKLHVYVPLETQEEKQKFIALALLVRLEDVVESIVILSAYGVRQELYSLFRVFLDAYFLIANVCSDPKFLQVYLSTDESAHLKQLNVWASQNHEMFSTLKQFATEELRTELKQRITDEKIQAFDSCCYAKNVGCSHIYDSMYRTYSASVHTGPQCLKDYFETDVQDRIVKIIRKDNLTTTYHVLYGTTDFLLKAMRAVSELFAIPDTNRIAELEAELETVEIELEAAIMGRERT